MGTHHVLVVQRCRSSHSGRQRRTAGPVVGSEMARDAPTRGPCGAGESLRHVSRRLHRRAASSNQQSPVVTQQVAGSYLSHLGDVYQFGVDLVCLTYRTCASECFAQDGALGVGGLTRRDDGHPGLFAWFWSRCSPPRRSRTNRTWDDVLAICLRHGTRPALVAATPLTAEASSRAA